MIYHRYGSTPLEVSAIGFGGMRFDETDDIDTCAALLTAAYDAGINYFDTAPAYPRSEEIFGAALKQMIKSRKARPFYVSTKSIKPDPADIRKDLETSLTRMHLDYIDFYHVWNIMSLDAYYGRKQKGALKEFERLKSEGLIKHICISTHVDGPDVAEILNDYPFEGILLGYSAMNFAYREPGIQAAADSAAGVVVMNPLGGGIIPRHPDRFGFVKTRPDETVVEAALRFLINDPRITIALVGFSNTDQIAEAISAVNGFEPLAPQTIAKIRIGLNKAFDKLCTSCRYCDNCPEGIPVPQLMDSYNYYLLSGKRPEMVARLFDHWAIKADDPILRKCTACGSCVDACTQKLPITERIKELLTEADLSLAEEAKKT